mgnify:CR=1 FL=1
MNTVPRQDGTKEKQAEFTLSKFHQLSVPAPKEEKIENPRTNSGIEGNPNKQSTLEEASWNSSPLVPDTDEIPF